jgi:acyl-CoA hydrolase
MRIFVKALRRTRHDEAICKETEAAFVFVSIDDQRRPRPLADEPLPA